MEEKELKSLSAAYLLGACARKNILNAQERKAEIKTARSVAPLAVAIGALGVRHAHGQWRPGHHFLDERRGPVPVGDPRGRLSSFISSSYWRSGDLSSRSNFERHVALLSVLAQHIHHTTERRASRAAEAQ